MDTSSETKEAQRWCAVQERSTEAEGAFVYAVATTGIFCRPSCPSRRPRRDNVAFFDTSRAAVLAGFRPCKRCRPHFDGVGRELGMAPAVARRGGPGEEIWHAVVPCSLGHLLVAWTARGVCQVGFGDTPEEAVAELRGRFSKACHVVAEATSWMEAIVVAVERGEPCEVPLDTRGTAFQERVWQKLQTIACGNTMTYGELARVLGSPSAARAVARACATNPIAVAVPCHRVVGADGALRGYRWGLGRKAELLRREEEP